MSDTRQVLEEAFKVIRPEPPRGNPLAPMWYWKVWIDDATRFRRFLDAEAWTDAALMLIPERYKDDYDIGPQYARLGLDYDCADHWGWSDVPALSLVEACLAALRAKEAGDATA